jgi:purine nucleoside phosphorylase
VVIPEDWFNPFDILHMSHHYDAHVVPEVNTCLRQEILHILENGQFQPYHGGVYVQTAGPRFETKAEVRFFSQFGVIFEPILVKTRRSHGFMYVGSNWYDGCK